jgi:excisionase family DNA binding protein
MTATRAMAQAAGSSALPDGHREAAKARPQHRGAVTGLPDLMTSGEVAGLFGVDRKTVTRWAAAGKLTFIRTAGGHRRYKAAEVRALLAPAAPSRAAPRRLTMNSPVPGLGPLESAIMNAIWDTGQPLTVRAARDRLDYRTSDGDGDDPAYSTIMTVMVILCRKGMLARTVHEQDGKRRAWWYEACVTREDHLAAVIREVLNRAPDPGAVLRRAFPALVLPAGAPPSAAPPAASAPETTAARAGQSVSTSAARARTRALRLLAREHYAEYAEIYEQVRPAAPDRYQARNRARMQVRNRHPDRYLELHAREQAAPGTDVPAGIRSKSWQRATARLAELRAPAYRELFGQFRAQGMNRPAAYDRAMAVLREADSDLFTRMLTEEYQL